MTLKFRGKNVLGHHRSLVRGSILRFSYAQLEEWVDIYCPHIQHTFPYCFCNGYWSCGKKYQSLFLSLTRPLKQTTCRGIFHTKLDFLDLNVRSKSKAFGKL